MLRVYFVNFFIKQGQIYSGIQTKEESVTDSKDHDRAMLPSESRNPTVSRISRRGVRPPLLSCSALLLPFQFPLSPRALAAAFELGAEPRMPMAVSTVTATHLAPSFPARSRRRRAAPRAAAGGLTARARRLRCEFVAGGGNGALSGEDDPRLVDRVRIYPLTSLLLPSSACPPFLLVLWHFVERVRRSP